MLAGSATLEQTLRAMAMIAQSTAFTIEVQATKAATVSSPQPFTINDANGTAYPLVLAETEAPDLAWVPEAFQRVQIAQGMRTDGPWPNLQLLGQPSGFQAGHAGVFRGDNGEFEAPMYKVDAVVFASHSIPELAERASLIMCRAFSTLIRRNEHLGGLVQLIQPSRGIEPGGSHGGNNGVIGAARQQWDIAVLNA